jgi:hypothetical protein
MWRLKSDFGCRHPSNFFRPHHAGADAHCKSSRGRADAIDKETAAAAENPYRHRPLRRTLRM